MSTNNMSIRCGDITLRPITVADTNNIVYWRNKDSVKKFFFYRDDFTPEKHTEWLNKFVMTGKVAQFIIEIHKEIPVGSVYLRDIDYENSSAEFGIFIGEDTERGKGIGLAATRMILNYGHNTLKLHRIFLRLLPENIAAYKTYKKAGFNVEGVCIDMKKVDGQYKDVMFMSSIYCPKAGD